MKGKPCHQADYFEFLVASYGFVGPKPFSLIRRGGFWNIRT